MIKKDSQILGRTFLRTMLDGTSYEPPVTNKEVDCFENRTEDDVGHEEDGTGDVILIANQPQILIHSFNLRVPNIPSIDMRKEVKNCHDGDQAEIDL